MTDRTDQGIDHIRAAAQMVARAFATEVRPDFLEQVEAYTASPLSGLEPDAQKLADRGVRQLEVALAKREDAADKQEWDDYLDASYAELFLGATMQTIAPQESVYYGREKVMYQQPYFDVLSIMKEWKWSTPPGFEEPEDHIAAEWAFYLFLLDKGASGDAGQRALEAASEFKSQHMDSWMDRAFQDIIDADDVGFYTGMVYIARTLMMVLK